MFSPFRFHLMEISALHALVCVQCLRVQPALVGFNKLTK